MKIILPSQKVVPSISSAVIIGDSLGHDLTIDKCGKYLQLRKKTLVEGLGPCVNLTAWAGNDKFVAHSAPEMEAIDAIPAKISKIVENLRGRLKNSFDEVHAFITGGVEYDVRNPVAMQSSDLVTEMYESLQKEGVPTTVIACQRGNGLNTRLNSLAYKDSICVFGKPVDEVVNSNKSAEDAINDNFDFVELTKSMPVILEKETI